MEKKARVSKLCTYGLVTLCFHILFWTTLGPLEIPSIGAGEIWATLREEKLNFALI